jgi:hypothetical protein
MKDEEEIKAAWEIWNLISRLNDLIWDFYEEAFIELLKTEYGKSQTDSQREDTSIRLIRESRSE